jgi:hypothetical protein
MRFLHPSYSLLAHIHKRLAASVCLSWVRRQTLLFLALSRTLHTVNMTVPVAAKSRPGVVLERVTPETL